MAPADFEETHRWLFGPYEAAEINLATYAGGVKFVPDPSVQPGQVRLGLGDGRTCVRKV
jgi:hypothetical protein